MDRYLVYFFSLLASLTLAGLLLMIARLAHKPHIPRDSNYRNLAECERALNRYSKLLERMPTDWEIYVRRAEAFLFLKNYQQAIRDFTSALALHPRDVDLLVRRAYSYYWLHNYDEAIWNCTRALHVNPHYTPAYELRVKVYFKSEAYELAMRDYSRLIEMRPDKRQFYCESLIEHKELKSGVRLPQEHPPVADLCPDSC